MTFSGTGSGVTARYWFCRDFGSMIRPYTDEDRDELLEVWYQASLVAHSFLSEEFLAAEKQQVAEHWLPMAETSVYVTDRRVVGFVALVGNEVGGIFVHPDHQGLGIGRALMDQARASRPFLELDVFKANVLGRRFYDAYGFELLYEHMHEATGQTELRLRLN